MKNLYTQILNIDSKKFTFRLLEAYETEKLLPLIQVLNEKVDEETFQERLKLILETNNYECVGIFDEQQNLIACSGLWKLVKFYIGKHLEVDNVAVLPEYRNYGLGSHLMAWVEDYAKQEGCVSVELNAYLGNEKAHKFYFKENYKILGFHFQKKVIF
jgi:GNAT superfamily N-acetyltransferase